MIEMNQRFSLLKEEIDKWEELEKEVKDIEDLIALGEKASLAELNEKIEAKEAEVFLSGKYDSNNAILTIVSGAGGKDAQDWAAILLRMYQRYCERKGFGFRILSQSFGEPGPEGRIGIKEVSLEIKGRFAYGFLRGESGVHRLVRLSPFSSKNLRHTSFALVDVLPQLSEKSEEIEIREDDLRIDTYRASGPGGQYVNKRDSAVRITHIPTKILVSCQAERTQGTNRKKALEMLKSKLIQLKERQAKEELQGIKGKAVKVEWGSQIRSYVFYPYKMIKDHRTETETSNIDDVLDGNLDEFIKKELQL